MSQMLLKDRFVQRHVFKINYYNSVNCDRPGECSPEKDCLR